MTWHRIVLLFFFANFFGIQAETIPSQPQGYITDLTQSLSSEEEERLELLARQLEEKHSHQVYVLLANSLEGQVLEEKTIQIAEQWKVGRKGMDDGLILFLFLQDRKIRIEVGYGLEGSITDALSNRIIQKIIVPRLKRNDLSGAIESTYQTLNEIFSNSNFEPNNSGLSQEIEEDSWLSFVEKFLKFGIPILLVFFFVRWILNRKDSSEKSDPKLLLEKANAAIQFLDEKNPFWAENQKKFDAQTVENKRTELLNKGTEYLAAWKSNADQESKLLFWISDVEKIQKRPKEHFPLNKNKLKEQFESTLKQLPWSNWEDTYSQESIIGTKQEWEDRVKRALDTNDFSEMEKLTETFKSARREPEFFLYPEWEQIVQDTAKWIGDNSIWKQYKKEYDKKLVEKHFELVQKRYQDWQNSAPQGYEARIKANRFWIANVVRVRAMPERFLSKKPDPIYVFENSTQETSSYEPRNNSYSSSSSRSSSSISSSSSSSGGRFGGGGASGSW